MTHSSTEHPALAPVDRRTTTSGTSGVDLRGFSDARRFAAASGIVAIVSAAILVPIGSRFGVDVAVWAGIGWFVMASVGVISGSWLTAVHGDTGHRFLMAMGTCMLARFALAGAGALVVAGTGGPGLYGYLVGLGLGYVPVQVFEMNWFLRRDRKALGTHQLP